MVAVSSRWASNLTLELCSVRGLVGAATTLSLPELMSGVIAPQGLQTILNESRDPCHTGTPEI